MDNNQKVVILTGGGGGAKLAYGLAQLLPPEKLTIIVNTGDDFEHLGLHISPDLDKVMYTLAGLGYPGQTLKHESWNMMAGLARYAGPTWYQLGDRDLATQLLRSNWLREGYPLSWVTQELSRRLGVRHPLLPMSDERVRTLVQTAKNEMGLIEYLAQKQPPEARGIRFDGAEQAQPGREVINAVREADVIILGPSNPLLSLGPILALPILHRMIVASRAQKIGVSCFVKGGSLAAPVTKIMAAADAKASAVGMAAYLGEVLTGFVLDHANEAQQDTLTELGLRTLVTGITRSNEEMVGLAREVLEFAENR